MKSFFRWLTVLLLCAAVGFGGWYYHDRGADDAHEREKIRRSMKPLSALAAMRNMTEADILREADVKDTGEKRYYLPFTGSKEKGWIAVLDDHADFLGFAKIDGFAKADK